MGAIDKVDDLEAFVLCNKNTTVLITQSLNEKLWEAYFPKNLHATSEEIDLTFKVHKISEIMLKKGIILEV